MVSMVEIVINTKTVLETWFVVTIIVLTFGQMLILLMIAVFLREISILSDSILWRSKEGELKYKSYKGRKIFTEVYNKIFFLILIIYWDPCKHTVHVICCFNF